MIITKLYKYDSTQENNNYRGEDFSKYILVGDSDTDDLTEVLDTVELTLAGLPFGEEFEPKTKFIYEKWEDITDLQGNKTLQLWKDWHIVVAEDVVSQPILSDNNYFNHNISFLEASAIAQGRLVDNIAITYRLKDINLDGKTTINENAKASVTLQNIEWTPTEDFTYYLNYFANGYRNGKRFYWKFPNWYKTDSPFYGTEQSWKDFSYYQEIDPLIGEKKISLVVPMLEIQNGVQNTKTFEKMGYCSVNWVVEETNLANNTKKTIRTGTTNPCETNETENYWKEEWRRNTSMGKGDITNYVEFSTSQAIVFDLAHEKKVADYDQEPQNRKIEFDAKANCLYTIKVYLKDFKKESQGLGGTTYDNEHTAIYETKSTFDGFLIWIPSFSFQEVNNTYPVASISFMTYEKGSDKRVWLKSAPIENAYSLYQKGQINTQNVIKQQGTPITETEQAFYLEQNDKQELQNTTIVENFYNQKNWWELQLEIGKYIHAIPKIRFGNNDRFVTTWQKLGLPTQYTDNSTKISIFNSKSIENYISACSSYVTNMVQLGGIVDEWVAPKSSSEDYLVYNDVAEIKTSKNIIEIVDMDIKCIKATNGIPVGDTRNLAGKGTHNESKNGYIFEENVYSLLDIHKETLTNKGLAIYYQLGSNVIKGLNYRLPTINTGDGANDYAIKRIIGQVYGLSEKAWENIIVNNFVFHIVYRTKDSVRSNQTRPDLRKYLLNSKYDRVPQHYQFNNQTDTVVDSVKFGNNVYGKLIRTGNSTFTTTEWNTSLSQLKQAGQLYNIRGNIYYVAKAKNTYYQDHIISEITYSKDYNQLSEIIGIPSEPRFYEISEQSTIQREVPINDYIVLGTEIKSRQNPLSFIRNNGWSYINNLLLGNETDFPKYAITVFKNDEDRKYGTVKGNENFYKDVCHPINTYSIQNTLTLEWDMVDNFSAGEIVQPRVSTEETTDKAYYTLQPIQYTDVYGRSDLVDFIILKELELSNSDIQNLPNSPITTKKTFKLVMYVDDKKADFDINNLYNEFLTDEFYEVFKRLPKLGETCYCKCIFTNDNNEYEWYRLKATDYSVNDDGYEIAIWSETGELSTEEIAEIEKPTIDSYRDNYLFGNEPIHLIGDNQHGLGLLKDNREQISINYNLQMITDSDRFVLSSYLWQPQKGELKLALLNTEINKISNDTIKETAIINTYDFESSVSKIDGIITINIESALNGIDISTAKAIAIISTREINDISVSGQRYFVMGRNIGGLSEEKAKAKWYISNFDKSMFKQQ
jgi:hypothetical protein